jgi:Cdc6-like AAA superfamily ATPase
MARINPDKSIARNSALKENSFALFTCIFNKIPIFITGSPGQSKTLSMNLILDGLKLGE